MIQTTSVIRRNSVAPPAERPTVCHVIHALGVGGAEVLVDLMVRELSDSFRCVVAVLDDVGEIGHRLRSDGFVVEHLHRQPGIDHSCARRLNAFARQQNAALLHAHQYTPFFQAMLSRGLMGSRPVLFTEHGRHFPDVASSKRSIVNRLLLRKQDRLVGCGEAVRTALIKNEGLPASRVEVVYNGVDLEKLNRPSADARSRIRQEFGFAATDFVVIQVARLNLLKDHQTALRAIDEARRSIPGLRLLIAGEGDERAAIEQTITKLCLQNHVVLAGSRNDVADLLAASDTFLMSSISEGIPLTIIEAMAAGVPVVATSVGGIPEMVTHGISGLLATSGDHTTLARGLVKLQQSPAFTQLIIRNGHDVARQKFSLTGMLNGYRRMYTEMLQQIRNR